MGKIMPRIENSFPPAMKAVMIMVVFILISYPLLAQDKIFDIASKKQLFIDDQLIDYAKDVTWQVNPPQKAGTVLKPISEIEGS